MLLLEADVALKVCVRLVLVLVVCAGLVVVVVCVMLLQCV
jgi:hypothetical protein